MGGVPGPKNSGFNNPKLFTKNWSVKQSRRQYWSFSVPASLIYPGSSNSLRLSQGGPQGTRPNLEQQ